VDGEENSIIKARRLAAYPCMGKASGENPEDKSSLGPVKSLNLINKNISKI
jgi:hypothetical protein